MQAAEPLHAPAASPRWLRWAVDVYLVLRLSTLGFTGLLPLVGLATVDSTFDAARAAWLCAIALAFHTFAYVLNDVMDLWVDRSEPLRADSPLVRGVISRPQALVLAWAQWPLACLLAWAGDAGSQAFTWLALAFAGMALYDVYGKRCPWPLLTDAVQALAWCALLMAGASFGDSRPGPATVWAAAYVFLCVMLVNGVHGALRDLANDQRSGARTTAVWFGAQAGDGSAVRVPLALSLYALALQAGLVISAVQAWSALGPDGGRAGGLVLVAGSLLAATVSLGLAFGRAADRRSLVAAGAWNIVATLLVLPALVILQMAPASALLLMLVFGLPVLAMWAYNGSHWHLPDLPDLPDPTQENRAC